MTKYDFKYFLHDNYEFSEILDILEEQGVPDDVVQDAAEQVRNAFYELVLNCQYDTDTGQVTFDSVR